MAKHDFYTDEDGIVDIWRQGVGIHNGPKCRRCGAMQCYHCSPDFLDEECESGQLELF